MKKINIRQIYYHVRHKYFTVNNGVVALALLIGFGWAWGSIGVMQRNYDLQKEVNFKSRQLDLAQLSTDSMKLENRYYKTREYQELAVRRDLGLVTPSEKVLILPENSAAIKALDKANQEKVDPPIEEQSNFQQWVDFLFGSVSS